jgi:ribosomal protein S18 acetylase RimI-like enzyme
MVPGALWQSRTLVPADAVEVASLIRTAFSVQGAVTDPPPSAFRETADSLALHIAGEGGAGVEIAGALAGAVLWAGKDGGLYLARLAVAPGQRGQGIARTLIAAAEEETLRRGLPFLHLGTRLVLTASRRLFASCGFEEVAEHAHPGFAHPTWVEMRKRLVEPL